MPDPVEAWFPGSPGRWPFSGHVRGRWASGAVRLAWAGRLAHSSPPEEGWRAAEALRAALAGVHGDGRLSVIAAAWEAVGTLPEALRARDDLSLLFVAADPAGVMLSGAGLAGVWVESHQGWVTAALSGSPLFSDPGVPARAPVPQPSLRPGLRFVGLPKEIPLPAAAEIALVCGVRT